MIAQLTVQPMKQPATSRQEVQPALQLRQLGKLQNSMLKDLPTGAGHRHSATGKAVLILCSKFSTRGVADVHISFK